jgi:outer membrane receptor for Fe3+-dicitrate
MLLPVLKWKDIFDTVYIASVSAEGLKVGNGRSIMTGIEYNF